MALSAQVLAMGVDVPLLLWLGAGLLLAGLLFAVAGRWPRRKDDEHRESGDHAR